MYLGRFGGGGSNGQVGQVRFTIHDWGYSHGAGHEILLSFNWGVNTPVIHSHGPSPYNFYYYTAGVTSVYDLWFSDTTTAPALNTIYWTAYIYSSGGWQNITDPGNSASATLITNGIYNTGTGVGIGTTNPGYTLDVNGTVNLTGLRLNGAAGGTTTNFGFYPMATSSSGGIGWGQLASYYGTTGSIASFVWTNALAQSALTGVRAAYASHIMSGQCVGVWVLLQYNYSGYPDVISPVYKPAGYDMRLSGGYIQLYQNSGGNAVCEVIVTRIS
jgi:hypothetical protein